MYLRNIYVNKLWRDDFQNRDINIDLFNYAMMDVPEVSLIQGNNNSGKSSLFYHIQALWNAFEYYVIQDHKEELFQGDDVLRGRKFADYCDIMSLEIADFGKTPIRLMYVRDSSIVTEDFLSANGDVGKRLVIVFSEDKPVIINHPVLYDFFMTDVADYEWNYPEIILISPDMDRHSHIGLNNTVISELQSMDPIRFARFDKLIRGALGITSKLIYSKHQKDKWLPTTPYIIENDREIWFDDWGTGMQESYLLLMQVVNRTSQNNVYLIDDMPAHLSDDKLNNLYKNIEDWCRSEGHQIIMTHHHPPVISDIKIHSI